MAHIPFSNRSVQFTPVRYVERYDTADTCWFTLHLLHLHQRTKQNTALRGLIFSHSAVTHRLYREASVRSKRFATQYFSRRCVDEHNESIRKTLRITRSAFNSYEGTTTTIKTALHQVAAVTIRIATPCQAGLRVLCVN